MPENCLQAGSISHEAFLETLQALQRFRRKYSNSTPNRNLYEGGDGEVNTGTQIQSRQFNMSLIKTARLPALRYHVW